MKRNLVFAAIAAIVAVGTAVSYSGQTEKSAHSDLAIMNIEALTYDEWGYDHGCLDDGNGCMLRYNRWYPTLLPKDM